MTTNGPGTRSEEHWREFLERGDTLMHFGRRVFTRIPSEPRCRLCTAPFAGPGGSLMRLIGKRPSEANPNMCSSCANGLIRYHGGAEVGGSMLFADIRGSTSMAETMSPGQFHQLLERFYGVASQTVYEHDGAIDKFVGDELIAMFYTALSGERHAARAIDAARALLRATGHTDPAGPWVPVGAGVHTGRVWFGAVGDKAHIELTAVGDAVNTTARLAASAGPGEILVSDDAAEAAGLDRGLERKELSLKGKQLPVRVVSLRAERVVGIPAGPCHLPQSSMDKAKECDALGIRDERRVMTVIDWLLDSDPSIRWQAMRDLADAPADEVAAERAKVAKQGWGARLLAIQAPDGQWGGGTLFPKMLATTSSLMLVRDFGLDPESAEARRAVGLVREHSRWDHAGQPFFEGEVEPCINGRAVTIGAYFGQDVQGIVDRLLTEQMADGGWNCEQENGSTRGSFHSTICVLEGLLEHERAAGGSPELTEARHRGEEYLLERRLIRRLSTGEIIDPDFTRFSYPADYYYDVLRGLDYFRAAAGTPDDRMNEAIALVRSKRAADGRWPLENPHPGDLHFAIDEGEGKPSRWNTLRALRVLRWYGDGGA